MYLELLGWALVILGVSLFIDKFIGHAKSPNVLLQLNELVGSTILTIIITLGIWLLKR